MILSNVKWKLKFVYLDNVDLFSETPKQHIDDVLKGLFLLHCPEASLKFKKRSMFTSTVDFLLHFLCASRLELAIHTTDSSGGIKISYSLTKRRSYLGLCKDP